MLNSKESFLDFLVLLLRHFCIVGCKYSLKNISCRQLYLPFLTFLTISLSCTNYALAVESVISDLSSDSLGITSNAFADLEKTQNTKKKVKVKETKKKQQKHNSYEKKYVAPRINFNATKERQGIFPSAIGPFKKSLILKPYLTLGYNIPIVTEYSSSSNGNFFSNLSAFQNWRVGVGLRLTQYLGIELAYDSYSFTFQQNTNTTGRMQGQFVYLAASAYSPALDLKYVTFELGFSLGMAIMITNEGNTITIGNAGQIVSISNFSTPAGVELFTGISAIVGFSKVISVRGFLELVTIKQTPLDIPLVLLAGLAINVYII